MTGGLSYEHSVMQLKNWHTVWHDGEFGVGWRRAAGDPPGRREDGALCCRVLSQPLHSRRSQGCTRNTQM